MKEYDYLIVGAGLFGSVIAYRAKSAGKKCLVIDKRPHIGGNVYCEKVEGINVHKYGAHIFHTSDKEVWDFVNSLVEFNRYTNSPVACYKGRLFNLPFNMNTFHQMWGVTTPDQAAAKLEEQRQEALQKMKESGATEPRNLEEQAQLLIGKDIYEALIKGYTEKQWGRKCTDLPAFIIKRLPVRMVFDNNYFNDKYQGIPIGGYNVLIEKLLEGVEVRLGCDWFSDRETLDGLADKIVFTGAIDEFYGYRFGKLEYRTVRFETEVVDSPNYQGNAVVNYTDREVPFTRVSSISISRCSGRRCTIVPRRLFQRNTVRNGQRGANHIIRLMTRGTTVFIFVTRSWRTWKRGSYSAADWLNTNITTCTISSQRL